MLLSGLDAVVATAAAEEIGEAFTVPLEAVVASAVGSVAATDADAIVAMPVCGLGASDWSGFSAEKSSAKRFVSIKYVIEAMTV